jgi:hypothetical protein
VCCTGIHPPNLGHCSSYSLCIVQYYDRKSVNMHNYKNVQNTKLFINTSRNPFRKQLQATELYNSQRLYLQQSVDQQTNESIQKIENDV